MRRWNGFRASSRCRRDRTARRRASRGTGGLRGDGCLHLNRQRGDFRPVSQSGSTKAFQLLDDGSPNRRGVEVMHERIRLVHKKSAEGIKRTANKCRRAAVSHPGRDVASVSPCEIAL